MSPTNLQNDGSDSSRDDILSHTGRGGHVSLSESFVAQLWAIWLAGQKNLKWTASGFEKATGCLHTKLCNWRKKNSNDAACGGLAVICYKLGKQPAELGLESATCASVDEYCRLNSSLQRTAESTFPWAQLFPSVTRLADVFDDVLSQCDGYLTWIKPFHSTFELLYGGQLRTTALDGDLAHLLRRLVFKPLDWVEGPLSLLYVPNCEDWFFPIRSDWDNEVMERNRAYIYEITRSVRSEIYVPIYLEHTPLACLNIHFPDKISHADLQEIWKQTTRTLNLKSVAGKIVDALIHQLYEVKQLVAQFEQQKFELLAKTINSIADVPPFFPPGMGESIDLGVTIRRIVGRLRLKKSLLVAQKDMFRPRPHRKSPTFRAAGGIGNPVMAGIASGDALVEVLERGFSELSELGDFEVRYGHVAQTPLVHITISKPQPSDFGLGKFSELLRHFEASRGRKPKSKQTAPPVREPRFDFLDAACMISGISCGQVDVVGGGPEMPAIRMEFPRAEMLPRRLRGNSVSTVVVDR